LLDVVAAVRVQKAENESRRNASTTVPVGTRHFDNRTGRLLRPFGEIECSPTFARSIFCPRPKIIKGQAESITGLLGGLGGWYQSRGNGFGRRKAGLEGFNLLLGRSKLTVSFGILLTCRFKIQAERPVFSIRLLQSLCHNAPLVFFVPKIFFGLPKAKAVPIQPL
jgi:hypothetical protein